MGVTAEPWAPLAPAEAAELLAGLDASWWIAGGWAIDLYLGGGLREHADLDVAVLRDDATAVAAHLAGWDLHAVTAPGELTSWDGSPPPEHVHGLWARPTPASPWAFELLLEEHEGDRWVYRRDPRVSLPLADFGAVRDGLPLVAPEVALLFKAKSPDEKAEGDFAAVLPHLDERRRAWLAGALALLHAGHPWSERL
ncbi:MAG: amino acid transporter [Actinobacteria bacterium]|nr:amino acid transporter [Actinomycetota bacterium]